MRDEQSLMRDEQSLSKNITSTGSSNKIFVRILFPFNSCYVNLIKWTFHHLVMCKRMSTTVCVNGTVKFIFFLVMRLNITIVKSCDSLIVILATYFFHH